MQREEETESVWYETDGSITHSTLALPALMQLRQICNGTIALDQIGFSLKSLSKVTGNKLRLLNISTYLLV